MNVHRDLAQSIERRAQQAVQRGVNVHIGEVLVASPLQVELRGSAIILHEDALLVVSQWVKYYDQLFGIQPGDNALIDRRNGVWHCTDIISDTDVSE